jgi:hypothetical protein
MNEFTFKIQTFVLNLRKNLRYSIILLPIIVILLLPLVYYITSMVTKSLVSDSAGKFNANIFKVTPDMIKITDAGFVNLSNNRRLFYSKITNRENASFGFSNLDYRVRFTDNNGKTIEEDKTIKQQFVMPREDFYIAHEASNNAAAMAIDFDLVTSRIYNFRDVDLLKVEETKIASPSNHKLIVNPDGTYNLFVTISSESSRIIKNAKFHYRVNNKKDNNSVAYLGVFGFSEIRPKTNDEKQIAINRPAPEGVNVNDLTFAIDYNSKNAIRYNYYEEDIR